MRLCMQRMGALLVCSSVLLSARAWAQSTAFTFQGKLQSAGAPVTGTYDLQFRLFDTAAGTTQIGATQCLDNVVVTAGLFSAPLDFGQQYAATSPRFLEVQVRPDTGLTCSNTTGFTVLAPRQQLTGAPAAVQANTAFSLDAPGGAAPNAVSVTPAGNVGVGTT